MRAEYLDMLPSDVREIVSEIEEVAGVEIQIDVDPARAHGLPDEPDPLACVVNGGRPRILIPTLDHFPEASVLHELLHIRRFILEGVPQLSICDDYWTEELERAFTDLDNDLEHLVIVPVELNNRPERHERWVRVMNRAIDREKAGNFLQDDRERFALRFWAFVQHVLPERGLMDRMQTLVQDYGVQERAVNFAEAILGALQSKEEMSQICIEHLRLQGFHACLEYIGSPRQCGRQVPLIGQS